MKTAYPLGALLGIAICFVATAVAPVREAIDNERHAKQQRAALVEQNKRLFKKLYSDAEAMTFPVSAYGSEDK